MRRVLLLFVKYPAPGRVKTRLAAAIGAEEAARAYRKMVAHVCAQLADFAEAELAVFYDPPEDEGRIQAWLAPHLLRAFSLLAQAPGDLGARLEGAFGTIFDEGADQAVVIGSDCVELTADVFRQAFAALEKADAVVGPTDDGGYYLLGMKQPQPALFRGIEWSTERTLAQTLARAEEAHLAVAQLGRRSDVDDAAGWERACRGQNWGKSF